MFNKVIDTNSNMQEGRMKDIAIDLMSKEKGGLDPETFKRKYGKSKADMQKELGVSEGFKLSFKEFAEEVNEWGILPSTITEAEYQGQKVKLNDPIKKENNKYEVYVKDGDMVKKIPFGPGTMDEDFGARQDCDNPGTKTKERYWNCYEWKQTKGK
jgi:hypothetical protein